MKPKRVPAAVGYLYVFQCGQLFKIGQSENPRRRVRQLRGATPFPVVVIHKLRTIFYREIERELHAMFASKRTRGEWFSLNADDLDLIKRVDRYGYIPTPIESPNPSQPETHSKRLTDWLFTGVSSGSGMPAMIMRLSDPPST